MYKRTTKQMRIVGDFYLPFGGKLDPKNRWVKLEKLIPWGEYEESYLEHFKSETRGQKAFSVQLALGALIIQTKMRLTDDEVPQYVMESPYLQYFLGLTRFEDRKVPFDASMLTYFRKRFSPEILMDVNERIVMAELGHDEDEDPPTEKQAVSAAPKAAEKQLSFEEIPKRGKMQLDATCAPSDVRYPTDLRLLNEAREHLERFIDILHTPDVSKNRKPRTYRNKARQSYLAVEKQRKKRKKALRGAIGKQLGYIRRDLAYINRYLMDSERKMLLTTNQHDELEIIGRFYEQQLYMYKTRTHSVENRIVSISQPHIRPIVRGKAGAGTEFGCKIMTCLIDGYTIIHKMSFDSFNEGIHLQDAVEKYLALFGCYPEAVLADTLFRNRENRAWLKERGIRISGPGLGRPPKVKNEALKKQARADSAERNAIEGSYGVCKRKYSLDLIKARLENTAMSSIVLQFLVMNLDRRLRSILNFFYNWPFCRISRPKCIVFALKQNFGFVQ